MTTMAFIVVCGVALAWGLTSLQVTLNGILRLTAAPRKDRWHRNPTPNSGGIAIFCSAALIYCLWFRGAHTGIALGSFAIWLLGLVDDRVRLRPSWKLLGQSAVAGAVVASGVVFHGTPSAAFNIAFSFCFLVGITNAFNLIDNMDGLCAGVTVITAAFRFCILAAAGAWDDAGLFALIGAVYLGFLILNYSPARIFMGDCGSMFAGFTLAALSVASPIPHTKALVAGVFYPALTFLYPIFDTALVSILRKAAGRPISVGGRDHSSHRLVSLGLSESRVVWILWALSAVGSLAAMLVHWMPMSVLAAGGLLCAGLTVFGIFLATLPAYPLPTPSVLARSSSLHRHLPSLRAAVILLMDVWLAGIALYSAFLVRFGSELSPDEFRALIVSLPVVLVIHAAVSYQQRSFAAFWTSFAARDTLTLVGTVFGSATCSSLVIGLIADGIYPFAVFPFYCVFCVLFLVALRFSLPIMQSLLLGGARPACGVENERVAAGCGPQ